MNQRKTAGIQKILLIVKSYRSSALQEYYRIAALKIKQKSQGKARAGVLF